MGERKLLEVEDLSISFQTEEGMANAVNGVTFDINEFEIVSIVGESGSGKSITAASLMKLLSSPPAKIEAKKICFRTQDMLNKSEHEMRRIRGNEITMIFQEPMTSLNPVLTVGSQIEEVLRLHRGLSKKQSRTEAIKLLKLVEIPLAERRIDEYPHRLSGGMRQRVMIAMALACHPKLLIADEPTTALDVTIQAQILDLIKNLQRELGMSVLLITHDLGVVAEIAQRIIVMYAGNIMEKGTTQQIFSNPMHPYTAGLLECIPQGRRGTDGELKSIPGNVPNPLNFPAGCRFQTRCQHAEEICKLYSPTLIDIGEGHQIACWQRAPDACQGRVKGL